ncbi:MAG: hypothetical protein RLZ47_1019 [Bacteroidota bacterium]|jgi:riboflavin transporter FmnP
MNKKLTIIILCSIVFVFLGCADKIEVAFPKNVFEYGFISGLWHGFIAPFSLIGMFLGADVVVFAINNSGFFYALGFLLGSGGWGILASKAKKKSN